MTTNITKTDKIDFHGTSLPTYIIDDKQYTAAKRIAEAIGLDWKSQYTSLTKDESFVNSAITIHIPDALGRLQETLCININKINGWLFKINPNKVKDEIKPKLLLYQEECFFALYNHFNKPQLNTYEDALDLAMRFNTQTTLILTTLMEQKKKQQTLETKVNELETKVNELETKEYKEETKVNELETKEYKEDKLYSIKEYANLHGIKIMIKDLGLKTVEYYRKMYNKEPKSKPYNIPGRPGLRVNLYPCDFLSTLFEGEGL